jgi:DNA-binding MarR family transcriptional regulator
MEKLLIEFIDTLDTSLKKYQAEAGDGTGISGLTINQLHYIEAIHALGEPTITEIAEKMKFTKASVTAGIHKLETLGYVTKTQSMEDKRVFHVRLTGAAGQLVKAKEQTLEAYGEFIKTALNEEEAVQFEKILEKLVKYFQQR